MNKWTAGTGLEGFFLKRERGKGHKVGGVGRKEMDVQGVGSVDLGAVRERSCR